MTQKVKIPNLSSSIVEHLTKNGYDACYAAYYSSKSVNVLVGVIDEAKIVHIGSEGLVDLVDFSERFEVPRVVIQNHFIDGRAELLLDDAPRPMTGTYLRIVCPIRSFEKNAKETDKRKAIDAVENCACFISLLHGEFVALEKHFGAIVSLSVGSSAMLSESMQVRQTFASESLNQELARIVDEERNCNFTVNERATSLLRRAHVERDGSVKFFFMWLALELILGSGAERKRFALTEMNSPPLNKMLNELRAIRDALVHDGELTNLTQEVYLQIKVICIMGLTRNPYLRKRLLYFVINVLSVGDDSEPSRRS